VAIEHALSQQQRCTLLPICRSIAASFGPPSIAIGALETMQQVWLTSSSATNRQLMCACAELGQAPGSWNLAPPGLHKTVAGGAYVLACVSAHLLVAYLPTQALVTVYQTTCWAALCSLQYDFLLRTPQAPVGVAAIETSSEAARTKKRTKTPTTFLCQWYMVWLNTQI
jgi:hypothetical protein